VRIFKSRWFQRFARKEAIADSALVEAAARAEKGQIDADLGGGVIKQRIARPGQGKSKGYRPLFSSGVVILLEGQGHSSYTGLPKANGRISMNLRTNSSRKRRSTSWR
jgi:hypothetical protein